MRFTATIKDKTRNLEVVWRDGTFECRIDDLVMEILAVPIAPDRLSILHAGKSYDVRKIASDMIAVGTSVYSVSLADPRSWRGWQKAQGGASGPLKLAASMPGKVVRVLVSSGDAIQAGEAIVVVEAMKMQNEVRAPRDGKVAALLVQPGQAVNAGEVVAIIE
jgi:biotin carboxyl carrier protein